MIVWAREAVVSDQKTNSHTFQVWLDLVIKFNSILIFLCTINRFVCFFAQIACQVSLASRFDSYGKDPSGDVGRQWRAEVEEKIEKWQELQTAKTKKALPKPDDMPATKRGGKRWVPSRLQVRRVPCVRGCVRGALRAWRVAAVGVARGVSPEGGGRKYGNSVLLSVTRRGEG